MKPRLLVLAKTMPLHDRASGDYRLSRVLEILAREFEVDFLSTTHVARHRQTGKLEYLARDSVLRHAAYEILDQRYIDDLAKLGVRTLNGGAPVPFTIRPGARYDIRPFLGAKAYDLIWVEFFYLLDEYVDDLRRFQPGARIVCDSVDLHFRRLARQCNYFESQVKYVVNTHHEKKRVGKAFRQRCLEQRRHADHIRDRELAAYRKCNAVVMVSEDDRDELARHLPSLPQLLVPNIHKRPGGNAGETHTTTVSGDFQTPFARRSGCVFVGNFDHDPNITSCIWLKHEVAPLLEKTAIRFRLVGSNPPKVVRKMGELGPAAQLFEVTGFVPETLPYLASARVSVAPILYGAGMNGKIGEAMRAGLPVVTTSLGALGMGLVHEETCLVADDAQGFANAIQRLHEDEALWNGIRKKALERVDELYSDHGVEGKLLGAVRALLPPVRAKAAPAPRLPAEPRLVPAAFPKAPTNPKFSVIVLAHDQWRYTELCLRSLAHAEKANPGLAEYILVDNASADGTAEFAARIPNLRLLAQRENLGFAAGNNAGIAAARGENVVLLNNDTVVAPEWLARFQRYVDFVPNLGVLGPATNTESGQGLPAADYASLGGLFALNERLGAERMGSWEKVKKVSGLCMVIPRAALERVGPLDAEFGLGYFEDDDFCLRAEDAGLAVAWAKDVYVHHFGSVSFGSQASRRARLVEEGMARFAFKWGKRGLEHILREHQETLLRMRRPRSLEY